MANTDTRTAMRDFGGMTCRTPQLVLRPTSAAKIAAAVKDATGTATNVVPRGCGHSSRGESLTNGVTIDMRGIATVYRIDDDRITVGAGATWRHVLEATLPYRRMPPVLTDYLDLTVGGTLSAAGIGGASHIHGTQTANVIELEIVTPTGETTTCSPTRRRDLFDTVRAGLGRHGIITTATLRLIPAPERVLSCRIRCASAAELIAAQGRIHADHISGQVKPSGFELKAVVYDTNHPPNDCSPADTEDLAFLDFADRMRPDVAKLAEIGEWQQPHPWGQVILPAARAAALIDHTLMDTTPDHLGLSGIILIKRFHPGPVPMLRAPADAVLFGLLRTASPGCHTVAQMSAANDQLYERASAIGGVPYPPQPKHA
jgi:FAD/FMN-containing dehydrogenase